jgi:hypothetical protein
MPATSYAVPITCALSDGIEMTLLELVQAICDETGDDREVVEIVRHLLNTGQVRLCGNFRNSAPSTFR